MSVTVEILNNPDRACDAFVARTPGAGMGYLYSWGQAVTRAVGLKSFYLVAVDEDREVCGVLPLSQTRSRFFGNRLISQAFSMYGGILADNVEVRDSLFRRAVELARDLRCESIEFRGVSPLPYDLHLRTGKVCMHLPLAGDPGEMWDSFDCKVRNQVRKAEKSDLTACKGGVELLDDFYRIYAIRMHQLGTPCYSRRLMRTLLETFPDGCGIFAVGRDGHIIGAGFVTWWNGFVEIPWAASLVEYNRFCPNHLLYWSVIRHFCLGGAKCFDFGRCTIDGPTYRFKKQWGATPVGLNYQYWVRPGCEFSPVVPDNPRYRRKVELWKRLPLWVTRLAGPVVSKYLG